MIQPAPLCYGRGISMHETLNMLLPLAGILLLLQGSAEIARCVICLKTGVWPSRLKDVSEIDVVEEQLSLSEHVDDETRRNAIDHAQGIEESARQRGRGGAPQS